MGSQRLPLSEAGRKEERQSGSYSWSVLRSSAPYTQGVSMLEQDPGELVQGRARECEQSCELGVGAGPVGWERRV